jgi:hypothetical protein
MEDPRIQRMLAGVDLYEGEELARASSITIHRSMPAPSTATEATEEEGGTHKRKEPSENAGEDQTRDRETKRRKEEEEEEEKEKEKGKGSEQGARGSGEGEEEQPTLNKKQRKRMKQLMRGTTKLSLEIREGRNRVIRRMCARVRLPLVHLHRVRIGNVDLADLGLEGRLGTTEAQPKPKPPHSPVGRLVM